MRLRLVLVVGVFALLCLPSPSTGAEGLTPSRSEVVTAICAACDRYQVDCTLPLAVARRESGFGTRIVSATDKAADGTPLSVGIYQWHARGLGGYRGPGFEDDWRWDVARDVERGVDLLTSHLRGGPDYRRHWWTPLGLDISNLPLCPASKGAEPGEARP